MIDAWSDSDSSDNKGNEDDVANLYFTTDRKELEGKFEFSNYYKSKSKEVEGTSTQQVKSLLFFKCQEVI